jgi:adenylate cyclase
VQQEAKMKIQFKSSEVLILLAASLLSFLANLPDSIVGSIIDKKVLLATLTAIIVVAMFRYLQMLLLLTIIILAIGANLPSELASALGISRLALIISLGVLVAIPLLNRLVKLLPDELEDSSSEITKWRQAVLTAVENSNQFSLNHLLAMNEDVNFTLNGTTPLRLAAEKRNRNIARILIDHGAVFQQRDDNYVARPEFKQANKKTNQFAGTIINVDSPNYRSRGQAETRRADEAEWRTQHD